MKKFVKLTAVVSVLVVALVLLVACGPTSGNIMEIGLTAPTATATKDVSADMSGQDMLLAAVENYYGASYVASVLSGNVSTVLTGGGTVTQAVLGRKIREGVYKEKYADDQSNYFIDNRSYSFAAKLYEETLIKPGDIRYRNVKTTNRIEQDSKDMYDITLSEKVKWNDIEDYKANMRDYIKAKSSDPRKIWAYKIDKETIASAEAPVFNQETNQYTFKVVMNIALSTEEYKEVMKYQLSSNAGVGVSGLEFTKLEFNVHVWQSGFLARLDITESYKMKLAGIIDSEITLNSVQYFSYNPNEEGYKMADYINMF